MTATDPDDHTAVDPEDRARVDPEDRGSIDAEVDARGLACPMPVIELSRAVEPLEVGATVRLLATDATAKVDVPVWCRMQRQGLRSVTDADGVWTFVVEKRR